MNRTVIEDAMTYLYEFNTKIQWQCKFLCGILLDWKVINAILSFLHKHIGEQNLSHSPPHKYSFVTFTLSAREAKVKGRRTSRPILVLFSSYNMNTNEVRIFQKPFAIGTGQVPVRTQRQIIKLQDNDSLNDVFADIEQNYGNLLETFNAIKTFTKKKL